VNVKGSSVVISGVIVPSFGVSEGKFEGWSEGVWEGSLEGIFEGEEKEGALVVNGVIVGNSVGWEEVGRGAG